MKECKTFCTEDGVKTVVSIEEKWLNDEIKYEVCIELTSPHLDMETIRITRFKDVVHAVGYYSHLIDGLDDVYKSFEDPEENKTEENKTEEDSDPLEDFLNFLLDN